MSQILIKDMCLFSRGVFNYISQAVFTMYEIFLRKPISHIFILSHFAKFCSIPLQEKYKMLNDKEQPSSFYRHEGQYNEERAGLYKTSYDPDRLTYSMNAQQLSGGALFNVSNSHVNASQYPTIPWDENEAALRGRSVFSMSY